MSKALSPGDVAPDFELPDQDGHLVSLAALRARGPVVLFFYPKDETAVCTAEACAFRDAYEEFQTAGATVLGVSSDSVTSHKRFADKHGFPYLLLADTEGALRARFGVPKTLGFLPGRATYVIDGEGVVRHRFVAALRADKHVQEALAVIKSLPRPHP